MANLWQNAGVVAWPRRAVTRGSTGGAEVSEGQSSLPLAGEARAQCDLRLSAIERFGMLGWSTLPLMSTQITYPNSTSKSA